MPAPTVTQFAPGLSPKTLTPILPRTPSVSKTGQTAPVQALAASCPFLCPRTSWVSSSPWQKAATELPRGSLLPSLVPPHGPQSADLAELAQNASSCCHVCATRFPRGCLPGPHPPPFPMSCSHWGRITTNAAARGRGTISHYGLFWNQVHSPPPEPSPTLQQRGISPAHGLIHTRDLLARSAALQDA